MQAQCNAPEGADDFIKCPQCSRNLCKKIGIGRYETKMKKDKNTWFAAEVIVGTITCPRCGYRLNLPITVTLSSNKEPAKLEA